MSLHGGQRWAGRSRGIAGGWESAARPGGPAEPGGPIDWGGELGVGCVLISRFSFVADPKYHYKNIACSFTKINLVSVVSELREM